MLKRIIVLFEIQQRINKTPKISCPSEPKSLNPNLSHNEKHELQNVTILTNKYRCFICNKFNIPCDNKSVMETIKSIRPLIVTFNFPKRNVVLLQNGILKT